MCVNRQQNEKIYIDVDILLQIIKDFRNTSKGNEEVFSGFDDLYWIGYEECLNALEDTINCFKDTKGVTI